MPRPRAKWSEENTSLLLHLCLQEKEKFNFTPHGLTREGWQNVYTHFPQYDRKQVNNKLGTLKATYYAWKEGQNASGLGRDKTTGGIEADQDWFGTQDETQPAREDHDTTESPETSAASKHVLIPPPFLDELHSLYGDRNQNSGTFISAGGVGGSTPPRDFSRHPCHRVYTHTVLALYSHEMAQVKLQLWRAWNAMMEAVIILVKEVSGKL